MSLSRISPSRRVFVAAGVATALDCRAAPTATQRMGPTMEATSRSRDEVATLVNVFTSTPDQLPELVRILKDGTQAFFSQQPGFIASSVLVARDGRRAINYSQWRSAGDIQAFRDDPYFAPYLQRIASVAKAETLQCDVVEVHHA